MNSTAALRLPFFFMNRAMKIEPAVRTFLEENAGPVDSVEPVPGHASARAYSRARAGGKTFILCRDETFTGTPLEEYPFYIVYTLLKERVPVPGIIAAFPETGLLLLEDLGDEILETVYPGLAKSDRDSLFREILLVLGSIQTVTGKSPVPFSLAFDTDKLMYEFGLFIDHCLKGYYRADISEREEGDLRDAFLAIARILDRPELFVLNHRDFQSRNIMIKNRKPWIVDFQDARMGLPQYDLVSLVYDDYISLDGGFREYLVQEYRVLSRKLGVHDMGRDEFDFFADISAFQRNIKVGGTFSFLLRERGLMSYEKLIPSTLAHVKRYIGRRPELLPAYDILRRHVPVFG